MSSPALRSDFFYRHRTALNAVFIAVMQCLTMPPAFAIVASTNQTVWGVALFFVATTALYFRYSRAKLALIAVVFSMAFSMFLAYPVFTTWWPAPVMVYHFARHGRLKQRRLILAGAILASFLGGLTLLKLVNGYGWTPLEHILFTAVGTFVCLALVLIPWLVGNTLRLSEIRQLQLEERTRQLEYEREQERQLAAQDERARIAREMHDIVAHSLSSIITQADGARYAAQAESTTSSNSEETQKISSYPPTESVEIRALETISSTARESLGQMRQLLGVLRTTEGTRLEPLPALRNIPQLIEQMRAAGFNVAFSDTISESEIADLLPSGAELVAYRVVQESLTNIRKHAASADKVEVTLSAYHESLTIRIKNSPPAQTDEPLPGSRRGLLGMRERINLYQGTLHYGELADGGFVLEATIPTLIR
ncbi:sensor histidine kinase [Rothia amarae]|uniref:sensor histidine kinase n=1 Tax=Rothia amarae TaxID=169480 RepID=UPI0033CD4EA8